MRKGLPLEQLGNIASALVDSILVHSIPTVDPHARHFL
jgi:hypothetical protein